jgi:hypothetical protein
MALTKKTAHDLIEELLKAETKLLKWRRNGIGLVVTKETHQAFTDSEHPKKDFVLQGLMVERRGNLRY